MELPCLRRDLLLHLRLGQEREIRVLGLWKERQGLVLVVQRRLPRPLDVARGLLVLRQERQVGIGLQVVQGKQLQGIQGKLVRRRRSVLGRMGRLGQQRLVRPLVLLQLGQEREERFLGLWQERQVWVLGIEQLVQRRLLGPASVVGPWLFF